MDKKVTVENLSPYEKKLTVEVPAPLVEQALQSYYASMSKSVKMKGFREGKAPVQMVKMQFQGEVTREVISRVMNETYSEAVTEQALFPVAQPRVEVQPWQQGQPLVYTACVEIKPPVEVKSYAGLSAEKEKISIDKKQVEATLEQLRESKAQLKTVSVPRGIQAKDFVVMDFEGLMDGKVIPGGASQNFLYEMGSNRFVSGFEEGLKEMKPEEQKEIQVTYPQDFHEKKLAGKQVVFKVSVKEIKEKEMPPLDDVFAQQIEGCKSVEELRTKIHDDLVKREENRIKKELEKKILTQLVEKNELTPPPSMVKQQYDFLVDDSQRRLTQMGLKDPELEEQLQKWEPELQTRAQFDVKVVLLIEALVKKEKLEISEKELDEGLEKIAKSANSTVPKVKTYFKEKGTLSQVRWQLLQDKAVEFLLSKAKIK
ncbi:MAG: trigger factor [Deltaproteobacteria bacterium]|nr:trigger factor [Deltaproteobacteria bacterium]